MNTRAQIGLVLACAAGLAGADEIRVSEPSAPQMDALVELTPTAAPEASPAPPPGLSILGVDVLPDQTRRLVWKASFGFGELDAPTPVLVAHGAEAGPVLCLTAAVHGDEINGIEIVRRVMQGLDTATLKGAVIGVPIVNLPGFQRGSRYLPDRRDLNRYFPGDPGGSLASRIAADFFAQIVSLCDYLVDVHTGSFARTNLPQLRADLSRPEIVEVTKGFGAMAVLHSLGSAGTLRRAATEAGIPAVTLETGEPERLQPEDVAAGVKGIDALMGHLSMTRKTFVWINPQPVFYESSWVRAERGGILFADAALGDQVKAGDVLGTVTDPLSNARTDIIAPHDGRVLGKALNQFVMPGFAAFRLGIQTREQDLPQDAEAPPPVSVEESEDDYDENEPN